jgi:hypothetical protein
MSKDLDKSFYKPLAKEAQLHGSIREVNLTQEELDHIISLCRFKKSEMSKGHVGWKFVPGSIAHFNLFEYFLGGKDALYRAPAGHAIDPNTGYRKEAVFVRSGLTFIVESLRIHGVKIPSAIAKIIKSARRSRSFENASIR